MKFVLSLIGMIFIIACPFWAYWTASGGWLMAGLGITFLLIAKDLEDEAFLKQQHIQNLKNIKAQKMAEQDEPETKPETMKEFLAKVDENI